MQELFKSTGGCVITSESFAHDMFTQSLKKLFIKDQKNFLKMGFNVRIEVSFFFLFPVHVYLILA